MMQGRYDKGQSIISIILSLPPFPRIKGTQNQNYPKLLKQTYCSESPLLNLHI